MDTAGRNTWLEVLRRDWDITTREELLETLDRMENGGHAASFLEIKDIIYEINSARNESEATSILRKHEWNQTKYNRFIYVAANWDKYYFRTIKAWDLGRNISLCRWGYNVGFITEYEAWEKIFHYAELIQQLYNSWEEYGYDYFMGRVFWASGFGEEESYLARTEPVYKELLNSYWGLLEWRVDLEQPETAAPVNTIRFLKPDDNDGTLQYMTNDPATYNRFYYNYSLNPNVNQNIYECSVKKISGNDDYGFGILFCVDDTDSSNISYYRFFITVRGMFTVAKRTGNTWADVTPVSWRYSSFIKTGYNIYNTLRVERTDNSNGAVFRIFINGSLAATFNDTTPINGGKAGPVVSVNVMDKERFPHMPVDVRYSF
jgi:glycerophosphoryl diester phosphodiesterase